MSEARRRRSTSVVPSTRAGLPAWVPYFNRIARPLIRLGVPMGPDVLLTVRGRRSGQLRSTPVSVVEIAGRLWLLTAFGQPDWARNLRAAGRATITTARREQDVTAAELGREEAVEFFRSTLNPYLRTHAVARWIVRNLDRIPEDPVAAAEGRSVFRLEPVRAR